MFIKASKPLAIPTDGGWRIVLRSLRGIAWVILMLSFQYAAKRFFWPYHLPTGFASWGYNLVLSVVSLGLIWAVRLQDK